MNQLRVGENQEEVIDEDAVLFYSLLSDVTNLAVEPSKDTVHVRKPTVGSRSAGRHILICVIRDDRYVCLKRCVDSPDYLRREVAVANARQVVGFPHYKVIPAQSIKLRNSQTRNDTELTQGWDNKPLVAIDFGPQRTKNLVELNRDEIKDPGNFLTIFGCWTAFNYLFTVRDRSPNNFVFYLDSQILISVDNEEGPFQSNGGYPGQDDIINSSHHMVERFIEGMDRSACIELLRTSFVEAWKQIKGALSSLTMFNTREITLIQQLFSEDAAVVARKIFY
jgi:hypothetical protein